MTWKMFAALALASPLAGCATAADQEPEFATCPPTRGWEAWINAMPGPGAVPVLIVVGEAYGPADVDISLRAGPLDRRNPPAQRFTLHPGRGGGPLGWRRVRGEVKPALAGYRAVIIGCNGKEIAVIDNIEKAY